MTKNNNIALGTAAIGRPLYINIKQNESNTPFSLPKFKENGLHVLDDAYNKGIRFFDTSPGDGLAEQFLVDWLQKKNDPEIKVTTKWGYTYVANFDPNAKIHEVKEHSLDKLNKQWEFSKMLLPYLKVYQIHSATFETGVLDDTKILERLFELKKEYKLTIGLTTTGTNQNEVLKKAIGIVINGEKLFNSYQCTFNILEQSVKEHKEVLSTLGDNFIIKEALANGRLIPNENYTNYKPLYNYLMQLATKYNVGVDAIALRYCIDSFPSATVLSGASNCIHLTTNLKANQFKLTEEELVQLSSYKTSADVYWQERKELTWN